VIPSRPVLPSEHSVPGPRRIPQAPLAVAPEAARPRRRWLRRLVIAGTLASLPLARTGLPRPEPALAEVPHTEAAALAEEQLKLTMAAPSEQRTDAALDAVAAAEAAAAAAAPAPLATVDGIPLVVPAAAEHVALVGFHEANGHRTESLVPTTPLVQDLNPGVAAEPGEGHPEQPDAMVLPSRARGSAPASAVDVALPEGVAVEAPVTGEVVAVDHYSLYGRYADTRIEIAPAARPDLRVVVLHVSDPQVGVGDKVTGGETTLAASATGFPFSSQIDRFVPGGATPHVHIEVLRHA
jgi:murein DD-endopeptidase MepM/ murein hydrolase activator NlpD